MKSLIYLILLIGAMAFFSSCRFETREAPKYVPSEPIQKIDASQAETDRALAAVQKFHELLNQGKSDEIFQWIDPKSQLNQDPVAWSVRFNKIKSDLGEIARSEMSRTAMFKKSQTLEARLEFVTQFTKDHDSRPRYELFYFELYPDGEVRLLDYRNGIDNEKEY